MRDEVQILTKFGIRFAPSDGTGTHPIVPDARPAGIRASVEALCGGCVRTTIDVYLQHRQDPAVPAEDVAGVMNELITEGKRPVHDGALARAAARARPPAGCGA